MSNYTSGNQIYEGSPITVGGNNEAERILSEFTNKLKELGDVRALTRLSIDSVRNRAIFQLTGEIPSTHVDDITTSPIPWMNVINCSEIEKLNLHRDKITAAIAYYLGNTDTEVAEEV